MCSRDGASPKVHMWKLGPCVAILRDDGTSDTRSVVALALEGINIIPLGCYKEASLTSCPSRAFCLAVSFPLPHVHIMMQPGDLLLELGGGTGPGWIALSSLPSPCPAAGRVATCQGSRPCEGKCLGLPASCCSVLRAGQCLFCFGGAKLTLAASCSSQDVGLTLESASLVIQ